MAKLSGKGSSATSLGYKKRGGVGFSFTPSPPLLSLFLSHPCRGPALRCLRRRSHSHLRHQPVPCTTEPPLLPAPAARATRPSPGSLPPLLQSPVHCHCRALATCTLSCRYTVRAPTASSVAPCPWPSLPCPATAVRSLPSPV